MKLVVQRVTSARVEVDGNIVGEIEDGLMVLVGFGQNDTVKEADYLAAKLAKLRIFEDENGRMNISVQDAHTKKNRPSFHKALAPDKATELFDYFTDKCSELIPVETGEFGAFMKVSLLNNGPVTILLEKEFE